MTVENAFKILRSKNNSEVLKIAQDNNWKPAKETFKPNDSTLIFSKKLDNDASGEVAGVFVNRKITILNSINNKIFYYSVRSKEKALEFVNDMAKYNYAFSGMKSEENKVITTYNSSKEGFLPIKQTNEIKKEDNGQETTTYTFEIMSPIP